MHVTDKQAIIDAFERVMLPVRALGWRLHLDYQPTTKNSIYAAHATCPPQVYTKIIFNRQEMAMIYERWFVSCAALLTQLSTASRN